MKYLLFVLPVLLLMPPALSARENLSGTWKVTMTDFDGHVSVGPCAIRQQGRQLRVQFLHGAEMFGTVEDRHAEWHWQSANLVVTFTAVLAETGNTMRGTWKVHFKDDGSEQNAPFSAVKTP